MRKAIENVYRFVVLLRIPIFYFIILINLIPVWYYSFFPTLDGPAHVYNIRLIGTLLSDSNSFINNYIGFNSFPEPNWIAHVVGLLFSFLPSAIIEKVLASIVLVITPLAFKSFVNRIHPEQKWNEFLIFAILPSYILYLGFYSFLLSIPIALYSLREFIYNNKASKTKLVILFALLYFSHLFVFVTALIIAGTYIIWKYFVIEKNIKMLFSQCFQLGITASPGIFLSVLYFFFHIDDKEAIYISAYDKLKWIVDLRALICYDYTIEKPFTRFVALLLLALVVVLKSRRIIKYKFKLFENDYLTVAGLIMLLLYFAAPDYINRGGYITVRLLYLFYFLLLLRIACFKQPKYLLPVVLAIMLYPQLRLFKKHMATTKLLNADAEEVYSLHSVIPDNAVLLPLNYSTNWAHQHILNYLGVESNALLLENYEALQGHFPLKWKTEYWTTIAGAGFLETPPYCEIQELEKQMNLKIEYIAKWKFDLNADYGERHNRLSRYIFDNYSELAVSPNQDLVIYKRR